MGPRQPRTPKHRLEAGAAFARPRSRSITALPASIANSERAIGLIAGEGEFPKLVLRGAKDAGLRVVVVGLRDCCDESIRRDADVFYAAGIARLGRWIRVLRRENITRAVMAGRVAKTRIVAAPWWRQVLAYLPDWTSIKLYFSLRDRRNDTLLRAVADEMKRRGVELMDSTAYCQDAMAGEGVLTRTGLPPTMRDDVELGWKVAKEMGRLDVGQSVAVKDKDIIAVEAIEGTDAMIERAGALCKSGGWTLVKTAKPNQDMRFDVPCIGPKTIANLARAGARVLVVEAGKTLLLERDKTLQSADEFGIVIVGRAERGRPTLTGERI